MKKFNPFKQIKNAFDIKKQAAKEFSKKQKKQRKLAKPKPQQKPDKTNAEKLNDELKFASSKLAGGSEKISSNIGSLLLHLSGTPEGLKPGYENEYYSIDNTFDGDLNKLFQHVSFKKLPDDDITQRDVTKIEQDPHMSPQQYSQYEQQYRSQAYKTLATRLNLSNFEILEQIMNSSPAWQIAKRGAMESDQTLERWQELYETMNRAQETDSGIFDWAIQQIENGKHTLNWLLNAIDDEIKLALQGKYSHRRKTHN